MNDALVHVSSNLPAPTALAADERGGFWAVGSDSLGTPLAIDEGAGPLLNPSRPMSSE